MDAEKSSEIIILSVGIEAGRDSSVQNVIRSYKNNRKTMIANAKLKFFVRIKHRWL